MGVWKTKATWSYGFKGGTPFLWASGEATNITTGAIFI